MQVMWLIHWGRAFFFFFFFFFFSVFFDYFLPFLLFSFLHFLIEILLDGDPIMLVPHPQYRNRSFLMCAFLTQFPSLYCLCLQTRYTSGSKIAPPALCPLCAKFRIHEIVLEILQWLKEKKKLLLLQILLPDAGEEIKPGETVLELDSTLSSVRRFSPNNNNKYTSNNKRTSSSCRRVG